MSQNLTQPEELDHALMEMSARGMQMDTLANDIKHLNKPDHKAKYGESIDPKSSPYSAVHK
jgi:hypothetical protein